MWFKKRRIYADAAAATPLSRRAKRELVRLLSLYGNAGALHQEGTAAKKELEAARKKIADAIGAHADEIVFTASGTEANNLAIQGTLSALWQGSRMHAITSAIEHQSVLEPLRAVARETIDLTELPVDSEGLVFPSAVAVAAQPHTTLVSIQLVNSEVGTVQPIREIAKEIRRIRTSRGQDGMPVYLHVDASQAPLWMDIKVEKLGVDMLTLDAQKVLGPKGMGALYVKRGTAIEPIIWGGSQESGLRAGTPNVPLAGAFAVALTDAQQTAAKQAAKTAALRDYLWKKIVEVAPDALLNGPKLEGARVANNINVSIPGLEADMAVIALDALGVAASTRSACSAGSEEPSHVIKALGTPQALAGTALRLTLLPSATKAECRRIARALCEVVGRYRRQP